ncbi:MAG TPA: hypothetical protein VLN08_03100 [Vicinamibacterales bacterium]|nr:hypothetical protein [Vicinamibacterales bacterium]
MLKRVALGVVFASQTCLFLAGAVALAALSVACGGTDQQPVNPASPSVSTAATGTNQAVSSGTAAVQAAKGPKTVPRDLSGELNGTFTFEMYSPYGDTDFIAQGEAKGTLSHLGLSKMYTEHQPNPIGDGTLLHTAFRIVAANGDEIRGTYADAKVTFVGMEGTDYPFDFYYSGKATLVISGGTGRFAGASGTINATFLEHIKLFVADWTKYNCTVAWTLAGTVNY